MSMSMYTLAAKLLSVWSNPRGGGGEPKQIEDQPHAKQIAYAPQPTLRSEDAERDSLQIASDEQRKVSDAWGQVHWGTKRK